MMSIFKTIGCKILSNGRFLRYWRMANLSGKTVVLMYHEIADDDADIEAWTVVKRSDFSRQMEYISEHFRVISLKDAVASRGYLQNGQDRDASKPKAVITFDDGYSGNRKVMLPIIQSLNIPVTVFVASQAVQEQNLYWYDRIINGVQGCPATILHLGRFSLGTYRINHCKGPANWFEIQRLLTELKIVPLIERAAITEYIQATLNQKESGGACQLRPLTITELQELADCPLVTIGAHSHCHNLLTQLTATDAVASVRTSKRLLESWTQRPVDCFAYPNGSYDDAVVETVKTSGFSCGLTTIGKPWNPHDSLFTIPRIGVGRYDSFDFFSLKASGLFNTIRDLK